MFTRLISFVTDNQFLKYKPMLQTSVRNATSLQLEEAERVVANVLEMIKAERGARIS